MKCKLQDLIDVSKVQKLLDSLHRAFAVTSAIIDNEGVILVASGWQDICRMFHRVNPVCEQECRQSNRQIPRHFAEAGRSVAYRCPHGLIESATPIVIDGQHLGNAFRGQLFLEEPDLAFFRKQASRFRFDEPSYMEAVARVPVLTQDQLDRDLGFIHTLVEILAESGLQRLRGIEREKQLCASEERYRTLIERAPDAILVFDVDKNRFVEANTNAVRLFGCAREHLLQSGPQQFYPPDQPDKRPPAQTFPMHNERALAGEEVVFERAICNAEGKNLLCEVRLVRLPSADRRLLRSSLVDITERKRTEKTLKASEATLRSLFRAAPFGISVLDTTRHFRVVNERMCEMLGYRSEELVGESTLKIYPSQKEYDRIGREWYADLQQQGSAIKEVRLRRKDGVELPVLGSASLLDPDAPSAGFVLTLVDITDRERAEQERMALQDQLHQAQKMEAVGQLAGGVAHDFNNLLTVILGNVDILGDLVPMNRATQEAAALVRDAAEQAVAVVRSLLAFSRRMPVEKKPTSMQDVVQSVARMLSRLLPASVGIVIDSSPESPLWASADAIQLQQVVLNLAINARDAMPNGGTLRISVSSVDGKCLGIPAQPFPGRRLACLAVSDTGEGIPEENRPHLFDPFFSTKPRGQGTGLGLSIVHGIVKNHDGRIDVESEVGKGSTFRIFLPCIEPESMEDAAVIAESPRGYGETLLVAEDDQFVRATIVSMLHGLGYKVIPATDGPSLMGCWRVHHERVRLLIMDVDLPGQSGLDCLRDLRGENVSIPIVLISGSADHRIEDEADERTFALRKPFGVSQLGVLVNRLLKIGAVPETRYE